jgi:hypothetical protein
MFKVVVLEFLVKIALIAVQNKQPIHSYLMYLYIRVKIL